MRTRSGGVCSRLAAGLSVLGLVALVFGATAPNAYADPPGPSITINDAVATESSCTGVNAVFIVRLSRISPFPVSVGFATANQSAIAGADYQSRTGTLTFRPRERTMTIVVPILGDQVTEGAETFVVNLSAPTNGTIADGQAMGSILNDPCDDQDTCTVDSCNPTTLACLHSAVSCDDGNICTSDTCNPSGGCQHAPADLGQTTCGTGACQRTVQTCLNGVPQTCTPGSPTAEVCNGLDDDCNDVVDGPGSEASCALANATATCSGGFCAIAACNAGFGDCDGNTTNGCESPLNTLTDCGTCGTPCARANGSATCASGSCELVTCNAGFGDCDGNQANGCESPLNTLTDCGACGTVCSRDNGSASCASGSCQLVACNAGWDNCDGNQANGCETNTQTSTDHCSACGNGCLFPNASALCSSGACAMGACHAGFDDCDGIAVNGCETNLQTSTDHCGTCGNVCFFDNASASCSNGACTLGLCLAPFNDCNGMPGDGCETNLDASILNCGGCGQVCPVPANGAPTCTEHTCGTVCNAGFTKCGESCLDLSSEPSHCGSCGNVCVTRPNATAACAGGVCASPCIVGFGDCDGIFSNGCETNLNTTANCGGCGNACLSVNAAAACVSGACQFACNAGFGDCDGSPNSCETDLNTIADCGACGNVCSFPNAAAFCSGGSCSLGACATGFGNCDNDPANGCETDLTTTANCGTCGITCSPGAACVGGACQTTCAAGFGDCDGNPANGCENNLTASPNCGACGVDCDSGLGACEHSSCANRVCQTPIDTARCLAPTGNTTSAGYCAFAEADCATSIDSDGDGLSDTWEDAGAIDLNCDGVYDPTNDVELPQANKHVKDVYLQIAYMREPPASQEYWAADTTTPNCPYAVYTDSGHKPQQDSIDLVVRAFAGAHLTPAAQPCGKPGDSTCQVGYACVDFACLPTCVSDADCSPSCNADCALAGGAKCITRVASGDVCRLWRLHVDPLPPVGVVHHDIVSLDPAADTDACANTGIDFFAAPEAGSHTPNDHANLFDYKTDVFNPKEAGFKHFVLFGHDNTCYGNGDPGCAACPLTGVFQPVPYTTGISEIRGNDSIVSLGMLQIQRAPADRVAAEAGVLMHELGHNLGLGHGGPVGLADGNVRKVNYLSSMNYLYQNEGIPFTNVPGSINQVSAHPDYSHQPLTLVLHEDSLSETVGVGSPGLQEPNALALIRYQIFHNPDVYDCPIDVCNCFFDDSIGDYVCVPSATCGRLGSGSGAPIDWNSDGLISNNVSAPYINGSGAIEVHNPTGTADWINLFYEFQCQPSYANGAPQQSVQLASAATEQEYREFGLDLQPPLLARLEIQDPYLDETNNSVITTMLFGSASLDVTKIDLSTVRLESASAVPGGFSIGDQDGDGRLDLEGNFRGDGVHITESTPWLQLTGALQSGRKFYARGTNEVSVTAGGREAPDSLSPAAD